MEASSGICIWLTAGGRDDIELPPPVLDPLLGEEFDRAAHTRL